MLNEAISKSGKIHSQISAEGTKLGDLRKIAKDIKKDHDLALELWSTKSFFSRQLAILIMDKTLIAQEFIGALDKDIRNHIYHERNQLADWLMTNQLRKDKRTVGLIETWGSSPSAIQRRIFWYHQARLRWMGLTPPTNTDELLSSIEKNLAKENPEVQWAMNFTAGEIGIFDTVHRPRCVALGEKIGLYKDEMVSKGAQQTISRNLSK